jgi:2-methylcitrate dehydratase PrpD
VSLTASLAEYALDADFADFPADVRMQSRLVLADTIGVLLAASREKSVGIALRTAPDYRAGRCTIIGHRTGADPVQAAFVNGIGGHDIELDDTHSSGRNHAAAVLVPAALAAAEEAGGRTGNQLLEALVAAYDVQIRVSKAMGSQRQVDRGFHPTAVCGPIGAAVVSAKLLGLSLRELQSAIALAASQSSGLLTYEDDSSHMVKSFHTGIAAQSGVQATLLARNGYRGAPDVLAGRHDILKPFGGTSADSGRLVDELGQRYEICHTSLKRHACCGQTHSAVDLVLEMRARPGFDWTAIRSIDIQLAHEAVPIIDGNPLWTHNIQYVAAVAARDGFVGPEHFTDEYTTDEDLLDLSRKVSVRGNDDLQSRYSALKGAVVEIVTGVETFAGERNAPAGSPTYPLTEAELEAKFRRLASAVLDHESAARLWSTLIGQESCDWQVSAVAASLVGMSNLAGNRTQHEEVGATWS